ncbi:MAG TPA: YggT family protein [Gammaproteobacteria bacterium]|nr:YggT family protein [Gammaproteobacteria bacterium]
MFINIGLFLLQTLFDLYIYIVILRFLLQTMHVGYFNPLSQFAIRFTQPIIKPLQKIFPEIKHIDLAIVFLIIVLELIKVSLLLVLQLQAFPNIAGLLLFALANLINKFIMFYFYAIIIRVILSWITPVHHNPVFFALTQLTEPVLHPIRRVLPMLGGFDLSPLAALIGLQLLSLIIVTPLLHAAASLIIS